MTFDGTLHRWIYRHRLLGKRLVAAAGAVLPGPVSRRLRAAAERLAFRVVPQYQGDTLPPVFHFWSNRYVRPRVAPLGFDTPEELYYTGIKRCAHAARRPVRVLSLGSGACGLELGLAARLGAEGVAVHIECVDFNAGLMAQARRQAREAGLAERMTFTVADCNRGIPGAPRDVVIVNQFFHHVENLAGLCAGLERALAPGGMLLTCDIVGRNGHVLWPSVDAKVQAHWSRLAAEQRFDRYHGKVLARYLSVDHAAYSNEGVRAQDIVQRLLEHFDFEVFVTFGGAIVPFVERRIGFNFDPGLPEHAAFIERVAEDDQAAIDGGEYPASNMIAVLRHRRHAQQSHHCPVSPAQHVALTRQQQRLVREGRRAAG